jgi:L-threonylcarbamoyladenylate synthase
VYPPTEANLAFFAAQLAAGAVVAIPTETVYGLAANACNPDACQQIFSIKGRPLLDPLIVHLADVNAVAGVARTDHLPLGKLAEAFWPGPLTVILPKRPAISDLITAGRPTVAVRVPGHPVARQLLQLCAFPLAAPSANPFGYVSPSEAAHVAAAFAERVPWTIDGGPCAIGIESTILDLTDAAGPRILRLGAIGADSIAKVLGCPVLPPPCRATGALKAPGTMERHYSPRTPVVLHPPGNLPAARETAARIFIHRPPRPLANDFWLSEAAGDWPSAARALFALLRAIDAQGFARIEAELPDTTLPHPLAAAIADRLSRAAARRGPQVTDA